MKGIIRIRETQTMHPLTARMPSVLVPIMGRPIISYALKALENTIEEWIVQVPAVYKEVIKKYITDTFPTLKVTFEDNESATLPKGKYLHILGDCLYSPEDLQRLVNAEGNAVLLTEDAHEHGKKVFALAEGISPKPATKEAVPHYSMGAYTFTVDAPQTVVAIEKSHELFTEVVKREGYFFPIVYPWDILTVQKYFLEKADIAYFVHPDAQVHVTAFIGTNVVVGAGVVIEEEVELQDVCLFPGVQVGAFTRIHSSVLGDNVQVEPDTIVDGSSHKETLEVSTLDGKKKKVVPAYSGAFAAPDAKLKGFYSEVTIIS